MKKNDDKANETKILISLMGLQHGLYEVAVAIIERDQEKLDAAVNKFNADAYILETFYDEPKT